MEQMRALWLLKGRTYYIADSTALHQDEDLRWAYVKKSFEALANIDNSSTGMRL